MLNGRNITESLLNIGDKISMGNTTFQFSRLKPKSAKAKVTPKFYTGMKLSVIAGPDKGKQFILDQERILIGKSTSEEEILWKELGHILLDDPALPPEQAVLEWQEDKKLYEIYPIGMSALPMQISRLKEGEGSPDLIPIKNEEKLYFDDRIILGQNILSLLRYEPFMETGVTKEKISPPEPQILKWKPKAGEKEIQPLESLKEEKLSEIKKAPPPLRVSAKEKLELKFTPPLAPAAEASTGMPVAGDITAAWVAPTDYLIEVVEGKDQGLQFSFLTSAMYEGRIITIGKKGKRQNEIEINDPSISNTQASLRYSGGDFIILNEARTPFKVENKELQPADEIALKSGDRIYLGKSILQFFDRKEQNKISNYELLVIKGVPEDQNKRFPIGLETVIGRSKESNVQLTDPKVSRVHALLLYREGKFSLEPKSKVNPTFVNGISIERGKERLLNPEDLIQLSGTTILRFRKK
jgi:pSer/pThr/pTyr-binding forkhead associated (FHA) protein